MLVDYYLSGQGGPVLANLPKNPSIVVVFNLGLATIGIYCRNSFSFTYQIYSSRLHAGDNGEVFAELINHNRCLYWEKSYLIEGLLGTLKQSGVVGIIDLLRAINMLDCYSDTAVLQDGVLIFDPGIDCIRSSNLIQCGMKFKIRIRGDCAANVTRAVVYLKSQSS